MTDRPKSGTLSGVGSEARLPHPTCARCAGILNTGEARVMISLSTEELEELIGSTLRMDTRERLLQVLALIDADRAAALV